MVNPCFAERYQDYQLAARVAGIGLRRALAELQGTPNVGARAAATTFSSPASERLKADVTDVGRGIGDVQGRIEDLIAYLATVEAKYERLWLDALAERERLEKESG